MFSVHQKQLIQECERLLNRDSTNQISPILGQINIWLSDWWEEPVPKQVFPSFQTVLAQFHNLDPEAKTVFLSCLVNLFSVLRGPCQELSLTNLLSIRPESLNDVQLELWIQALGNEGRIRSLSTVTAFLDHSNIEVARAAELARRQIEKPG